MQFINRIQSRLDTKNKDLVSLDNYPLIFLEVSKQIIFTETTKGQFDLWPMSKLFSLGIKILIVY